MGTAKKIMLYVCLFIVIFIIGMMVRRFYDNHYLEKPPAAAGTTGTPDNPSKRTVEPAKELPPELQKKAEETAQTAPSGVVQAAPAGGQPTQPAAQGAAENKDN